MAECEHEWAEEYYGTRCAKCKTFYPHGCAPWDDDVRDGFDFGDDEYDNDEDLESDEWVADCGDPECCMNF